MTKTGGQNISEINFSGCVFHKDGFASLAETDKWRIGTVCIAAAGDGYHLLVQKAVKTAENYEFSGMWSFPGGMLRSTQTPGTEVGSCVTDEHFRSTIMHRLNAESGLAKGDLLELAKADRMLPLVSSYTAKGQRRYTLILPYVARLKEGVEPATQDRSISDAQLKSVTDALPMMSPANSIYGMLLAGQSQEAVHASSAWKKCARWASEAMSYNTARTLGVNRQ